MYDFEKAREERADDKGYVPRGGSEDYREFVSAHRGADSEAEDDQVDVNSPDEEQWPTDEQLKARAELNELHPEFSEANRRALKVAVKQQLLPVEGRRQTLSNDTRAEGVLGTQRARSELDKSRKSRKLN